LASSIKFNGSYLKVKERKIEILAHLKMELALLLTELKNVESIAQIQKGWKIGSLRIFTFLRN
jgi:hypothetical protein